MHPLIRVLFVALPSLAGAAETPAGAALAGGAPAVAPPVASTPAAPHAAPAVETSAQLRVPLFGDRFATVPVATIDDEAISLRQLADALAQMHGSQGKGAAPASSRDFMPMLDRLIDIRLIVMEGRDMEFDALPDVKQAVAIFAEDTLRAALERKVTRGVEFDPAEVEQGYKEAVREWLVSSALLDSEANAKALVDSLKAGKTFAEENKRLLAEKKAQGTVDRHWVNRKDVVPELAGIILAMREPGLSAPVLVKGGYAVVQVHEVRYPNDPAKREEFQRLSKEGRRVASLEDYFRSLLKKYAKVDQALLKQLDYEAPKPGFAALAKDKRVLVTIRGSKPITVADLSANLSVIFFHGIDEAIKEKRVNSQKKDVLRAMLLKLLFTQEAKRQGLENSEEYKQQVRAYEDRLVFQAFLEKVLASDVTVTEEQGKAYYEAHKADFKYPAFYKLDGLAFGDSKSAEAALAKLKTGTDLQWLRGNADGQLKRDQQKIQLDGRTLSATAMPDDVARLLAGSKPGDYRLYTGPDSQYYVINVLEVTPETYQDYPAARTAIGNLLMGEHLTSAIREYAAKLRKAHDVRVYISRIDS